MIGDCVYWWTKVWREGWSSCLYLHQEEEEGVWGGDRRICEAYTNVKTMNFFLTSDIGQYVVFFIYVSPLTRVTSVKSRIFCFKDMWEFLWMFNSNLQFIIILWAVIIVSKCGRERPPGSGSGHMWSVNCQTPARSLSVFVQTILNEFLFRSLSVFVQTILNEYLFRSLSVIPHICHIFYTSTFWGLKNVHSKVRKFAPKTASRQNSVNQYFV